MKIMASVWYWGEDDERILRENTMDFLSTSYYYTKVNDVSKILLSPWTNAPTPYLGEKPQWGVGD